MNTDAIAGVGANERRLERMPGIRPVATLSRHLDAASRRLFPAVTTTLALLLLAFPLGVPLAPELREGGLLASVFFWTLYRPGSMPPTLAFALGLLADVLGPEPIGVSSLVLLAVHGATGRRRYRLQRRAFAAVWAFFAVLAPLAAGAQWLLTAALELRLLSPVPALLAATLAVGLYPFLSVLLAEAHVTVAAPERA